MTIELNSFQRSFHVQSSLNISPIICIAFIADALVVGFFYGGKFPCDQPNSFFLKELENCHLSFPS